MDTIAPSELQLLMIAVAFVIYQIGIQATIDEHGKNILLNNNYFLLTEYS